MLSNLVVLTVNYIFVHCSGCWSAWKCAIYSVRAGERMSKDSQKAEADRGAESEAAARREGRDQPSERDARKIVPMFSDIFMPFRCDLVSSRSWRPRRSYARSCANSKTWSCQYSWGDWAALPRPPPSTHSTADALRHLLDLSLTSKPLTFFKKKCSPNST